MNRIKLAWAYAKTRTSQVIADFKDGVLMGRTVNRRELVWASGIVLLLGECL